MARKRQRRCKFGVNRRTGACLKHKRRKKAGAKRRTSGRRKKATSRRKKAPMSGSGTFCLTSTRPRRKGEAGRGGIKMSTRCYGSIDKALAAANRSYKGAYSVMIHRKGRRK